MEFKNIIGVNMAKETLELVLLEGGKKKLQLQVMNHPKEIRSVFRKNKIDLSQTLICLEHTGIYNNHLLNFFSEQGAQVWLENPVHIKRSLGLVRGKNDKVDADRIARFAYDHQAKVRLWHPKREVIEKLKLLMSQRVRLMKAKKALEMPIAEAKKFCLKEHVRTMKDTCKTAVKGIKKNIDVVIRRNWIWIYNGGFFNT